MKKLLKNRGFKIWFSVTVTVVALAIVLTLLGNIFYDIIKIAIGGEKAIYKDTGYPELYEKTTNSKAEALENANDLNEKLCEEGFVLLKNGEMATEYALQIGRAHV